MVTLSFGDVVRSLGNRDPDLMICAPPLRPLAPNTEMVLINEEEGETIPAGFSYLLEIFLATDVLEVWSEWRHGRSPTDAEAVAAIEWYGDHDAYQPVDA